VFIANANIRIQRFIKYPLDYFHSERPENKALGVKYSFWPDKSLAYWLCWSELKDLIYNFKMFLLSRLFIFTLFFYTPQAFAGLVYLKGQLGLSVTTDGTIDNSEVDTQLAAPYPITLGVGFHLSPMHSLSLELNYETMDIDELPPSITAIGSDTQTQVSAMFNYYFHTPKLLILEPFLGLGVGYTQLTIEKNDFEGEGFTWQVILGADVKYTDFIYLSTELRLFNPVDVSLSDSNNVEVGDFDTSQVKLMVGLKIKI
jgi:hypothetical protein